MDIIEMVVTLISGGGLGSFVMHLVHRKKERAEASSSMDEFYHKRIDFLKREVEYQSSTIETYKKANPPNGHRDEELEKLLQEKYKLMGRVMELESQIKFYERLK
jgi:predicted nuclease with TOPRIM domain